MEETLRFGVVNLWGCRGGGLEVTEPACVLIRIYMGGWHQTRPLDLLFYLFLFLSLPPSDILKE